MAIIHHLTDTDLYKLTMMQAVLHRHPDAGVRYRFQCRNGTGLPRVGPGDENAYLDKIEKEIDHFCSLHFTEAELSYLSGFLFFKTDFIDYLKTFRLNRDHIKVWTDHKGLQIDIKGPWTATILFEVPVLAIVSQLYCEYDPSYGHDAEDEGARRLTEKIGYLNDLRDRHILPDFIFVDMGTRRRYSFRWQERVLRVFAESCRPMFNGTSNIYLAGKMGIQCIGTMAHEWLQAHQQLEAELADSQKAALRHWAAEYQGRLGIALSDVVGFKAFLNDFHSALANLYSGARHDSGDPYDWARALIQHYETLKIDPKSKTAVFSDGLDFKRAVGLYRTFQSKINTVFGIGTWLTNEMGVEAPQIVIKMVECNNRPVAKVSDTPGKTMCEDPAYEAELRRVFKIL